MPKMLQAEIWTVAQTKEGSAVLLRIKNKNLAVPIFVGQLEIQSILIGIEGLSLPRPLTHDLFLNLLDSLNLSLNSVEIHEIKDNTFHAHLIITGGNFTGGNTLILDSRPSDALGLATRRKCPVLISADVAKQTGIPLDMFIDALEKNPGFDNTASSLKNQSSFSSQKRKILIKQLNDAVESEEYEQAAKIRDILKEMEEEN